MVKNVREKKELDPRQQGISQQIKPRRHLLASTVSGVQTLEEIDFSSL